MAGIVSTLCEVFDLDRADFVMGLWKSRLPHYLLWYTEGVENVRKLWPEAPSWSWLSFGGSVDYHPDLFMSVPLMSVLKIDEKSLLLQGFLFAITDIWKYGNFEETPFSPRNNLETWRQNLFSEIFRDGSLSQAAEQLFWEGLFCCPICHNLEEHAAFGLVLRPTGIERGQYQRVGLVLGDDNFQLPQSYTIGELDESLYQEFDERKGFTIALV